MTKDDMRLVADEVQQSFEEMRSAFPIEWLIEHNVTSDMIHDYCAFAEALVIAGRATLGV